MIFQSWECQMCSGTRKTLSNVAQIVVKWRKSCIFNCMAAFGTKIVHCAKSKFSIHFWIQFCFKIHISLWNQFLHILILRFAGFFLIQFAEWSSTRSHDKLVGWWRFNTISIWSSAFPTPAWEHAETGSGRLPAIGPFDSRLPEYCRADAEQSAARPFFTLEKAQDGHVILKYCKRKNLSPMAAIFGQMNIYVAQEIEKKRSCRKNYCYYGTVRKN